MRYYTFIPELNEYVRVVEEPNGEILNIMEDRLFNQRKERTVMKIEYFKESDMLYIEFSEKTALHQKEIMKDFVVDTDELGNMVGIEIEHASKHVDVEKISTIQWSVG